MTTKASLIDLNGNEMILDADGDTSITADTDDQIDFKVGGSDRLIIDSSGNLQVKSGEIDLQGGNKTVKTSAGFLQLGTSGSHHTAVITAGSERMRITNDGKVGIGKTDPNYPLVVAGTNPKVQIYDSAGNGQTNLYFGDSGSNLAGYVIYQHSDNVMRFGTDAAERMRIASDGTLFHNRTSDFYMSDSMASKNLVLDGGTSANDLTIVSGKLSASTMYHIGFFNSNSHVGNISTNGYATSYTTSSDYRHKENVNYEWRGLEKINNLKPAQFNFINETEIQEGFLAHEAQEVTPYAVVGEKDGETKQTMDYGRITPILVKAIQEQQEQIESLQQEIEVLKNGN